ncbi:serine/threonine dehydratase [Legionella qingyii]|uniref:Serine/threonine dehydratase n=1 Tax=Legionella qingyii TaxID=2184757 RepID=A0A317TYC0_9GAMM|nr:threonine/serine dehydratase [Legionella qingyii]PWY54624.1 serine/threonine dehydratase [Legionella qingyii]RUR20462.1 threonine/serine dehydratase [Legionella qingyii]RUR22662.1 threonine/serine dehydratase [Legionella qingyii]
MFDLKTEVIKAEHRIRAYIRETPLDFSVPLSKLTDVNLHLKCENLQYTGSFKVRGAFNALLSLNKEQQNGIVAASTGNHGAAVAYGLHQLKLPGVIFVPENVSPVKKENIGFYNASFKLYGQDCVETELHAIDYAKQQGMVYVSPYNNTQVIAGQGTIAVELMRQLDSIDVIFIPIGGGGLIGGIAGYMKAVSPKTKIIGCLPENSPVMSESIKAGKIISMETLPTLSDATAGGIEPDSITLDLCRDYVDDFVLVSENEIQSAIVTIINTHHLLIEGAAGVALAACLKCAKYYQGKNAVVVLSGANISLETLRKVIQ